MVQAKQAPTADFESYLAFEQTAPEKHEYLRGEVYPMVGATLRHGRIALNLATTLDAQTASGPCRVYICGAKVRVEAADASFYPDVVVSCDPRDSGPLMLHRPCLVVEVLSPSTAAYDRGAKCAAWRQLESLVEYVVVETQRMAVDVYRRGPDGTWIVRFYGEGDTVELASVSARVPMSAIYDRLPPEEPEAPAVSEQPTP